MSKAPRNASPDQRFRGPIEAALASGVAAGDMRLRLTLRDASLLARDRTIAVADIRFEGGDMLFLGVRVEQGGVQSSTLDLGAGA